MIEEDFYGQCKKEEGIELSQEVRAFAGDCFENRRCNDPEGLGTSLDKSNQTFVGFRVRGECDESCTNQDIGLGQDLRTLASQRYKRQQGITGNSGLSPTVPLKLFKNVSQTSTRLKRFLAISMLNNNRLGTDMATKTVGPVYPNVESAGKTQAQRDDFNARDLSTPKSIGSET